jgi:3-methyl-2-oxobutanoate hydroxymethyltransferase
MSRPSSMMKVSRALLSQYSPVASFAAKPFLAQCQMRYSSHSPMGASGTSLRKKITLNTIRALYKKGEPITMLTAHDFPSGHVADLAGMEMVLVGDSLAMVALGMEDTSEVLLEEMILHCRSVSRAAKTAFTVCNSHPLSASPTNRKIIRLVIYQWVPTRYPRSKPSNLPSG